MVLNNKDGPITAQPGVKQKSFAATVNGSLTAGQAEQEGILSLKHDLF